METLIFIAVFFVLLVQVAHILMPQEQPPQIIYVQTEAPQNSGLGCLPMFLLGILIIVVVQLLVG